MFDHLTRLELYALHSKLNQEGERLHVKFMALPSALSDEACLLMAKTAEISETMHAVYAEITRRNAEADMDSYRIDLARGILDA